MGGHSVGEEARSTKAVHHILYRILGVLLGVVVTLLNHGGGASFLGLDLLHAGDGVEVTVVAELRLDVHHTSLFRRGLLLLILTVIVVHRLAPQSRGTLQFDEVVEMVARFLFVQIIAVTQVVHCVVTTLRLGHIRPVISLILLVP